MFFVEVAIFLLTTVGLIFIAGSFIKQPTSGAVKAVRCRQRRKLTATQVLIAKIAAAIERFIKIDPIKRSKQEQCLKTIGDNQSRELCKAKSMAAVFIFGSVPFLFIPIGFIISFPPLSVVFAIITPILWHAIYSGQIKSLEKQLNQRKSAIERELPQFAGTIRQCLNNSRDIVGILESYRKVCGPVLQSEIDKTLNDIKTGNTEKALKAFEGRINSSKLSELIRGLISVSRGDDQKVYFEVIAHEYIKAENENVRRELMLRPKQLRPYSLGLFACMAIMLIVAFASFASDSASAIFG